MNISRLLFAALIVVSLTSRSINSQTNNIEGLWISTEESTTQFGPAVQKVALLISSDSKKIVSARSFFMWNGEYKMDWKFAYVKYDPIAEKISMVDLDSDTLICRLNVDNQTLNGAIHSDDEISDPFIFVRSDKNFNSLFYPRIPDKNGEVVYQYNKPEQIGDYLQTDSIFKFVKDTTSVYSLMDKIINHEFGRLESILIIKDQELILEEYFYNYNRTKLHRINSCTKSVTSLLLGITLYSHNMTNVNQSVFNFLPQYASLKTPDKESLTLKHLLTMSAGLDDEGDFEGFGPDDFTKYILSSPMETNPGERFRYSGKCSNLLGGIIYTLENKQADEFAKEVLFNKLGISDFNWDRENGVLPCDAGLELYPRDMAKIGLMVLNNGSWNGEQIVPEEWIAESTKPYVAESDFFDYSYQWWCRSKSNKSWWDDPVHGSKNEHDMFLALGAGGQYIMVIRDLNMVIVTTTSDYDSGYIARSKIPMAIEEIVPIFEDD